MVIAYAGYFLIVLLYYGVWFFVRSVYRRYQIDHIDDFMLNWFFVMGAASTVIFFIVSLANR